MPLPKPFFKNKFATIYHADCFSILHQLKNIDGVITDPPYSSGGAFRSDRTQTTTAKYCQTQTKAHRPEFTGDNRDQRSYLAWSSLWLAAACNACKPGAPVASFIDWRQLPIMTDAIQAGGWTWRGIGVWSKKFGRPTGGRHSNAAEYLVWGSKGPMPVVDTHHPCGIIESSVPTGKKRKHVAQKPVDVMAWASAMMLPGTKILDPFMGSGSMLLAARDRGCKYIGIECDKGSCELAIDRLKA